VDAVSDMVDQIVAELGEPPSMLIHGDLKPDHMLIDGDRVSLIDFDLMGRADPVVDIAHMLAFLRLAEERSRSQLGQPESAAQIFAQEYFAHVPPAWQSRLPLYHAMTGILKAGGLSRRQRSRQGDLVEAVLREGKALLSGEAGELAIPSFKRRLTRPRVH
jgi:aminoglycoside phosphotransferase (APT) family kinase protein